MSAMNQDELKPVDSSLTEEEDSSYEYSSSDSSYTTDESSDDSTDEEMDSTALIEAWSDTMNKLKYMMDLYKKSQAENESLKSNITNLTNVINEIKNELTNVMSSQSKAVNDLVIEKEAHAITVKQLQMLKKQMAEKPQLDLLNCSLQCKCNVVIANGEIESINIIKDDKNEIDKLQKQKVILMNRITEIEQNNLLLTEQNEDLQMSVNSFDFQMDEKVTELQEESRKREIELNNKIDKLTKLAQSFIVQRIPEYTKSNESNALTDYNTIIHNDDSKQKLINHFRTNYKIDISDFFDDLHNIDKKKIKMTSTKIVRTMTNFNKANKPNIKKEMTSVIGNSNENNNENENNNLKTNVLQKEKTVVLPKEKTVRLEKEKTAVLKNEKTDEISRNQTEKFDTEPNTPKKITTKSTRKLHKKSTKHLTEDEKKEQKELRSITRLLSKRMTITYNDN